MKLVHDNHIVRFLELKPTKRIVSFTFIFTIENQSLRRGWGSLDQGTIEQSI